MGKYELLYIVHPDLESSIDKITDRVKSSIKKRDGKVTYEESWGKRKLAYEIKRSETGIYILIYFELPKQNFEKLERDIRLTEEIMRFMVLAKNQKDIKPAKKVIKKEEEVEEKPKKADKDTERKEKKISKESKKEKKKAVKKPIEKRVEKAEEPEEERMKKIDEKLGAILGKRSNNKEDK